jgi:hypothetical protein
MTTTRRVQAIGALALAGALGAAACRNTVSPTVDVPAGDEIAAASRDGRRSDRRRDQASMDVHRVPFHVTYVITNQLLAPGDAEYPDRCPTGAPNAATTAAGEGEGTHLGRLSETESTCIDFATLALTQGQFTLRAANGDLVQGEFEGSASFDPPPPNALLSCTWTIDGGTGRFAGATGAGVCVDSYQLGDGRSHIGFEGWIRY